MKSSEKILTNEEYFNQTLMNHSLLSPEQEKELGLKLQESRNKLFYHFSKSNTLVSKVLKRIDVKPKEPSDLELELDPIGKSPKFSRHKFVYFLYEFHNSNGSKTEKSQNLFQYCRNHPSHAVEYTFHLFNGSKMNTLSDSINAIYKDYLVDKQKFVEMNQRLVFKIAKKHVNFGLTLFDLHMYGNVGLHHAVDGWDPLRGKRFCIYGGDVIKKYIFGAIDSRNLEKNLFEEMTKFYRHQYNSECINLADFTCIREKIELALKKLKPKERKIIHLIYWGEKGQSFDTIKIGKILKLDRSRISQIKTSSLKKLKEILIDDPIYPTWLDNK